MRYTRIGFPSFLIGLVLVAVVFGFAWSRSDPTRRPDVPFLRSAVRSPPAGEASKAPPPVLPGDAALASLGAEVFAEQCASCHSGGRSRGRAIPPLTGYAVELFVSEGGRDYLIDLLFNGRVRTVGEDGTVELRASHPDYSDLSDAAGAAVLIHMLTSWGNSELLPEGAQLYTPSEVAARRALGEASTNRSASEDPAS